MPRGVKRWRITVGAGHKSVVQYLTGTWHRWRPGGRAALVGDGQFGATHAADPVHPVRCRAATAARCGRASPVAGGKARDTVNVLSMDDYLRGVIPTEMPASWQPEAVRGAGGRGAHLRHLVARASTPPATTRSATPPTCQVYGGSGRRGPAQQRRRRRDRAADPDLRRQAGVHAVLVEQRRLDLGGQRAVPDRQGRPVRRLLRQPRARLDADARRARGSRRPTRRSAPCSRIQVTRRDGNGEWRGRVWTWCSTGRKPDVTVSGDSFRARFGLRSAWFTFG